MNLLTDEALIEAYKKSIELNLDLDFLTILENEIRSRKIDVSQLSVITDHTENNM
ncbi:sporulation histidine kinase inhibitor Sda [Texcoconibacillus texcoconensis]|uniref:Sporulation histidine kinase inhibitor Sda n=1 Tax=Texcoconibacillus texcoconensis TaxID=1095777 RepID=A0A840QKE9_9BACI|nr:sporulation histidine kinase inhibitor Sda [Texcoconibacillus texcoconensis]MBB5171966.1 hypothetical protein [Texcoconibacillus texcoconensis]